MGAARQKLMLDTPISSRFRQFILYISALVEDRHSTLFEQRKREAQEFGQRGERPRGDDIHRKVFARRRSRRARTCARPGGDRDPGRCSPVLLE